MFKVVSLRAQKPSVQQGRRYWKMFWASRVTRLCEDAAQAFGLLSSLRGSCTEGPQGILRPTTLRLNIHVTTQPAYAFHHYCDICSSPYTAWPLSPSFFPPRVSSIVTPTLTPLLSFCQKPRARRRLRPAATNGDKDRGRKAHLEARGGGDLIPCGFWKEISFKLRWSWRRGWKHLLQEATAR